MTDLISRQAAIDYCYALINAEHLDNDEMNYAQERVNQTEVILHHLEFMPSAYPKKGKWIVKWSDTKRTAGIMIFLEQKCSECGVTFEDFSHDYKYCPMCGARMDEE